jgi:hypothetical protein
MAETSVGFLAVCANTSIVGELMHHCRNLLERMGILALAVVRMKFYGTFVPFV